MAEREGWASVPGASAGSAVGMVARTLGVDPVRDRAQILVGSLHVLLEASSMEERGQPFADRAAAELAAAAHDVEKVGGRAKIELRDGTLWVDGVRFRVGMRNFPAYAGVVSWLTASRIDAIEFDIAPTEDRTSSLLREAGRLLSASGCVDLRRLADLGLRCSRTDGAPAADAAVGPASGQHLATSIRSSGSRLGSVYMSQPLVDAAVEMGAVDLRIAKGVVQGVVDRLHAERALLPALTKLQAADRPVLRHAAAVCLFAVLLGRRLGLGEELLLALGAGGLMHDIGRLEGNASDPPETDRGHGVSGFVALLRAGCRTDLEFRAASIVLHHHDPLDSAPIGHPDAPPLLPAIVGLADRFDHASNVAGRFTPEAGLWELRRAALAGNEFSVLVDAFVPALEHASATRKRPSWGQRGVIS